MTTTATLSGFRRKYASLRTVIAGDGWGTIAVPVIEATQTELCARSYCLYFVGLTQSSQMFWLHPDLHL